MVRVLLEGLRATNRPAPGRTQGAVMKVLVVVGALALAGCVSTTEPVSMGDGTYMIATNARGGFKSDAALSADTIRAAHAYCIQMGKKEAIVQTAANSGTQGWTPQNAQVTFKCS
ncbi:MAG: hypothetical protein K0R83_1375 [Caulobacter sp.]|jgi:hypothetical protein|nr:hypothetical protein [Caulobacter sp.]